MRFFAALLSLIALTFGARVHAQGEPEAAPPAIEERVDAQDPPPPLAPENPAPAPTGEGAAQDTPAPEAPAPSGTPPAPDARADGGCGSWPVALAGSFIEGGALVLGGLTFCVGGLLATITPTSSSTDCVQACVDILFAIAVIALGVVIAGAGLVILGPLAAISVTIAMAVGAAGAGRTWWPAVAGGTIGVVTSAFGVGLLVWALTNAQTLPFIGGAPLTLADAPHSAFVGGMILTATSGAIALGAGLAFDAVFGAPVEEPRVDDAPPAAAVRARPAPSTRAVHAMAY